MSEILATKATEMACAIETSEVLDPRAMIGEMMRQVEEMKDVGYRVAADLNFAKPPQARPRALGSLVGLATVLIQPGILSFVKRPRRLRDLLLIAASPGAFDIGWYLQRYPDTAGSQLDPLLHYVKFGAGEGRWPNSQFDSGWYLSEYPDIAEKGCEPLAHYLRAGRREGRLPNGVTASAIQYANLTAGGLAKMQVQLAHLSTMTPKAAAVEPEEEPVEYFPAPEVETIATSRPAALKKILFVVNNSDLMTHHYRVYNYSAALEARGYECIIESFTNSGVLESIEADILILCRITSGPEVFSLIDRFRAAGRPVVFDIDDLVFDPARVALLRQIEFWSEEDKRRTRDYIGSNQETLRRCDFATASTYALRAEIEAMGVRAFVVPNNIGRAAYDQGLKVREERALQPLRPRTRFAYFSGTATHEHDFAVVKDALHHLLQRRTDVEFLAMGELSAGVEFERYGDQFIRIPLAPHAQMLEVLSSVDVNLAPLELDNAFTNAKSELKIFEAALYGIPTIASPTTTYAATIDNGVNGLLAWSPFDWLDAMTRLADDRELRTRLGDAAGLTIAKRFHVENTVNEMLAVYQAAVGGNLRHSNAIARGLVLPKVSIIAILYNKAKEVGFFLEALRRQSYEGEYEVVLVDDRSPDDSVGAVKRFERQQLRQADSNPHMRLRIIQNTVNLGNCGSRNAGIAQSDGEIVVVVDADCMLNRDFLAEHVAAYLKGDADACFGPMNIETGERSAISVLNSFEPNAHMALEAADMQDGVNLESFVNTITRNFSIRREYLNTTLEGVLFDEAFSYSASPDSGFGWEDVEMGCRLYKSGARLKFIAPTASIHVSHPDSVDRPDKALASLKNFRRLHEKHPDIVLLARQWGIRTYGAIINWARGTAGELNNNHDYIALEDIYGRYIRSPVIIDRSRKLRILTYRWHVPHQYELYKTGHEFTLATHSGSMVTNTWGWGERPLPSNAKMVDFNQIDPRDFDLAILHFDENALRPDLIEDPFDPEFGGKLLSDDWGTSFVRALQWDMPKIAICHGTPQFTLSQTGEFVPSTNNIERLRELCWDTYVVCNAHQAKQDWNFHRSEVIWHGFSPHEYALGPRDRGVLSMPLRAMKNRPRYNGYHVYEHTAGLARDVSIQHLRTPDPMQGYVGETSEWARAKFQNYAHEISAYSAYFNPTERSPMPRSRGEAMMAGLPTVSLRNYDVDLFIRNGENGFYAESPAELADQLRFLTTNELAREKMGAASRRTALDVFNQDRYLAAWSNLINRVV